MSSLKFNKGLKWLIKKFSWLRTFLWITKIVLISLGWLSISLIPWTLSFLLTGVYLIGLWKFPDLLYSTLKASSKSWAKAFFKIEIHGQHHVPQQGKAIITARHRNIWDIPFMTFAASQRKIKFVVGTDSVWLKSFKPLQNYTIERDQNNFKAKNFRKISTAFNQDYLIGIFPERTRFSTENDYDEEVLRIAEKTDTPIIPLNIKFQGPYSASREKNWLTRLWEHLFRIRIKLKIGSPLTSYEIKENYRNSDYYRQEMKEDYSEIIRYFLEEIVDQI